MKFKNLFLSSVVAMSLVACQPKRPHGLANDGPYECISATIMVAGKPMTTVVQWNSKTGMARLLDTMVVTSKVNGAQNIAIGWVPLGDLQNSIQELIARNQATQQQAPQATVAPAAAPDVAVPATASSKKKK